MARGLCLPCPLCHHAVKRRSAMRWLLLVLLVAVVGCKAGDGERCAKPDDCAVGLMCGASSTCGTPESLVCAAKNPCKDFGLCTDKDGECVATEASCAASSRCKDFGYCTENDGKCVATEASCAASPACKNSGFCTEKDGKCVATEASCAASLRCKDGGYCTAKDGWCVKP